MNAIAPDPPLLGVSLRQPPSNPQAEQALLGAILANNKAYPRVADFLLPEHFADPVNQLVYAAAQARIAKGQLADAVTLKAEFESAGTLAEVGGAAYLAQLLTAMVGINTAGEYGRAIYDAWKRRVLIDVGAAVVEHGFDAATAPDAAVSRAVASLEGAFGHAAERRDTSLGEAVKAAIEAAEFARDNPGGSGLATGFAALDQRLEGMRDGQLLLLAGRPGMGKSALGWQIALNVARDGVGVVALSLEMTALELGRRALAVASRVPLSVLKHGRWTPAQADAVVKAQRALSDLPLTICDGGGLTPSAIDIAIRAAHRKHGVGFAMVDHLHIVRAEAEHAKAAEHVQVNSITRDLKIAAKRHRIPILLLAQLNRGVEGRDDKRPTMSDLRQAGEQDADAIMLLYRAEYYHRPPEGGEPDAMDRYESRRRQIAGKADVNVAKLRDGEPGDVELRWDGPTASFGAV